MDIPLHRSLGSFHKPRLYNLYFMEGYPRHVWIKSRKINLINVIFTINKVIIFDDFNFAKRYSFCTRPNN